MDSFQMHMYLLPYEEKEKETDIIDIDRKFNPRLYAKNWKDIVNFFSEEKPSPPRKQRVLEHKGRFELPPINSCRRAARLRNNHFYY